MKDCTAAFKAHLASGEQTTRTCLLTVKGDGAVQGFTDHDVDITYNLESYLTSRGLHIPSRMVGSGSQVYDSNAGYARTDIATGSDLSVDNLEVHAPMVLPAVTEDVLQQGGWDDVFHIVFWVNYKDLSNTMGAMILRCGKVGSITLERNVSKIELHGLTKAYTRVFGELTCWLCRAELGDARCGVNLVPLTVTGALTSVSTDGLTLSDTSRTEPGPVGGVSITAITQANPGHVTTATALGVPNGTVAMIAGATGMTGVNAMVTINNPSGTGFDLGSDTSSLPAYIGSGIITPLGNESGYFDYGMCTMTSGLNAGFSRKVKSYVEGQWTLMLPFFFANAIGDTYSMEPGCDKAKLTCRVKYDNVKRMRAEPDTPGQDKTMQIGRQGG